MRYCPFAQRAVLALNVKNIDYEVVNIDLVDNGLSRRVLLIQALCYKLVKAPELVTDDDVAGYFKALDMLQMQLLLRGTKFFDGPEPGYADYMIWPWFERLPSVNDKRIDMDDAKYRVLLEYIANMWEDSGVKEYAVPKEIIQAFHKAYALGNKPDYDVLLEE